MYLVRPYPYEKIAQVALAISSSVRGDIGPIQRLYQEAALALAELDPDEVADFTEEYPRAAQVDRAAAQAALEVCDSWEGIVSVGATIRDPKRFRGFAWLAAQARYQIGVARPDVGRILAFGRGDSLPNISPEDSALFACIPALCGLGPELAEEVTEPCPLSGKKVGELLNLPGPENWEGIDPLDGMALSSEDCRGLYPTVSGRWREMLGRGVKIGLLIRQID